ncbi:MAG: MBL fold metallo-hydrolase [Acidimicrobiales bacterium]|nr:MBL fold metallo-hydrolase [Acidimicrobiales bacterium]
MSVEVTLLGTGSPIPDPGRAGPSTLVRTDDALLLVDAGRGCVMRLAGAGVLPPMLSAVLLTHLHSDHLTDLNDVITTHWVMNQEPAPLEIHGPPGTEAVVDAIRTMLALDERYRIDHHDDLTSGPDLHVVEHEPGEAFAVGDTTVTVQATDHRPVAPTIGYRVEHGGAVAALAGDTLPCDGLDALCADADLYVQTVIRDDLVQLIPVARIQDILDYHSTVAQAAQTAARNQVRTLVLTHYVPAMQDGQEDEWQAIAAEHFDGDIVLGPDGTTARA